MTPAGKHTNTPKASKAQQKATEFFKRHAKRPWTAVFNGQLEAQIHDETLCLELRAAAWIERYSWGNNSDSVCDANGMRLTQSDFARQIGMVDSKGKADRRAVSPVFVKFKRRGLIRTEGQEIFPIDDPAFAESSSTVEGLSDIQEDLAKVPTFRAFIEEIVAREHPDKFKAYQETAQRWKEIRTDLLHLYEDYAEEMSASPATSGDARPKAPGQSVGEPPDASGKANRHSPDASLLIQTQTLKQGSSSSFSTARTAFAQHAPIDDDGFKTLLKESRKHVADITEEELVAVIEANGPNLRKIARSKSIERKIPYAVQAIVNAVQALDFAAYRQQSEPSPPPDPIDPEEQRRTQERVDAELELLRKQTSRKAGA